MYECSFCGVSSSSWLSRCPACESWNTYVVLQQADIDDDEDVSPGAIVPVALASIRGHDFPRYPSDLASLDSVLGNGLVRGSLVLIGGEPGIGKSTLLLQACMGWAFHNPPVLYVTAEETLPSIRLRADRLGEIPPSLWAIELSDMDAMFEVVSRYRPRVVVIDSVQTMSFPWLDSMAGGVVQVLAIAERLKYFAHSERIPFVLVSHVTKDGDLAGPRGLEHMVDVVLEFRGDRTMQLRELYAVKNRFGATGATALLTMTERGLLSTILPEPSELRTREPQTDEAGS